MIRMSTTRYGIFKRFLSFANLKSFEGKKMPEWIQNHPAFEAIEDVEKIYPKIGLSNFREPVKEEINFETSKSNNYVENLLEEMHFDISETLRSMKEIYENALKLQSMENRDQIIIMHSLLDGVEMVFSLGKPYKIEKSGTTSLIIDEDIFGSNGKIYFRAGESLIKVYNKLKQLVNNSSFIDKKLPAIEQTQPFKDYLKNNTPITGSNFEVVFASTGDGSWDLATMGERGIRSCQSWSGKDTDEHNACLIGSILSKYVGIIYLTNNKDFEGKGGRMIKRCIVRIGVNIETKSPVIILDKMYDSHNPTIAKIFINALQEKTHLPVLDFSNKEMKGKDGEIEKLRILYDRLPEGVEEPYVDTRIRRNQDKINFDFSPKSE